MWQQSRYKITNNNSYELKILILSLWAINKKTQTVFFLKYQHYDATYGNKAMISFKSTSCRVVLLSIHLKRLFCGKSHSWRMNTRFKFHTIANYEKIDDALCSKTSSNSLQAISKWDTLQQVHISLLNSNDT